MNLSRCTYAWVKAAKIASVALDRVSLHNRPDEMRWVMLTAALDQTDCDHGGALAEVVPLWLFRDMHAAAFLAGQSYVKFIAMMGKKHVRRRNDQREGEKS